MVESHIDLWGEKMLIRHSETLRVQGNEFPLHEVSASDDTQALILICSKRIAADTGDTISLIDHALSDQGLHPTFVRSGRHLFLDSVSPLDEEIKRRFGEHRAGIIALINGHEPGQGTQALDEIKLHKGDILELLYRVGSK